jgi:hypothetical protein
VRERSQELGHIGLKVFLGEPIVKNKIEIIYVVNRHG